jgi:hypothetical protein
MQRAISVEQTEIGALPGDAGSRQTHQATPAIAPSANKWILYLMTIQIIVDPCLSAPSFWTTKNPAAAISDLLIWLGSKNTPYLIKRELSGPEWIVLLRPWSHSDATTRCEIYANWFEKVYRVSPIAAQ